MTRKILTLCALLASANCAWALELGNVRVTNGLMGTKRGNAKFLPGDTVFVNFKIKDLKVDVANGTAIYRTKMEITDSLGKSVFSQSLTPKVMVLLGGKSLPSFATATLGPEQPKGKYTLTIWVKDLRAKVSKTLTYNFEVLPPAFGIVQAKTPAVAFAGLDFSVGFSLVGMKRDKMKLPKVTVTLEILDSLGKKVLPKPVKLKVEELHDALLNNLARLDVVGVVFPLFLNRPGRFTFQVEAFDELGKRRTSMRFPVKVLNPPDHTGG